jgi:tRNA G18 (ribose-2'-O)-methylase SpoU
LQVPLEQGSWSALAEKARRNDLIMYAAAPGDGASQSRQSTIDFEALKKRLATTKVGLVLGSEGQGVDSQILTDCQRLSIPMPGLMESLNVAVSGCLLMLVFSDSLGALLTEVYESLSVRVKS